MRRATRKCAARNPGSLSLGLTGSTLVLLLASGSVVATPTSAPPHLPFVSPGGTAVSESGLGCQLAVSFTRASAQRVRAIAKGECPGGIGDPALATTAAIQILDDDDVVAENSCDWEEPYAFCAVEVAPAADALELRTLTSVAVLEWRLTAPDAWLDWNPAFCEVPEGSDGAIVRCSGASDLSYAPSDADGAYFAVLGDDVPPFLAGGPIELSWSIDDFEDLSESFGDLGATLAATVGDDRYAGLWVDRVAVPNVLQVAVVGGSSDDESSLRSASGLGTRLKVWSTGIENALAAMNSCRDAIVGTPATIPDLPSMVYVARQLNRVVLASATPDPGRVASAVASGDCTDTMVLWQPASPTPTHGSRLDYPPYDGGLILLLAGGSCTGAFASVDYSTGSPRGLSAGHCADVGTRVYNGRGASVSTVDASTQGELPTSTMAASKKG